MLNIVGINLKSRYNCHIIFYIYINNSYDANFEWFISDDS